MDEEAVSRFKAVWVLANSDDKYHQMLKENGVLEKRYFDVIEKLPIEELETIQDFLMSCEDLSSRMLEVACEVMRFPTYQEVIEKMKRDGAAPEIIAATQAGYEEYLAENKNSP